MNEYFHHTLRKQPLEVRLEKLKRMKDWILKHKQEIRDALFQDFQKPEVEVDLTDIKTVLWELDMAISHLHRWTKPKRVGKSLPLFSTSSFIQHEALGMVLIIAPWNFPFNLSVGPLVSAIAAGNAVVLKPSELTSHTSDLIERMVTEIFIPFEVWVVKGDAEISKSLLKLPFDHFFFTGSTHVGKQVYHAAADVFASITLELGGMNPALVSSNSNWNDVAKKILYNKTMNAGQSCLAINYLMVFKKDIPKLRQAFQTAYAALFPDDKEEIASIINEHHAKRINALIQNAIELGAIIEIGNVATSTIRQQKFLLLTSVSPKSTILHEEIFGPVLPVIEIDNLEQALTFINARPKPLAIYIFTKDKEFYQTISQNTSSGTMVVNDTTLQFMHPYLPFGGVNHSGISKAHGYYGYQTFSNAKSVLTQVHGFSAFKLVFPPYTNWVKRIVKIIFDWF